MRNVYRKMLLFSATVVFLATAPLVILYAMGYRIGSSQIDPLPVGVLFAETRPRSAAIEVNGRNAGTSPQAVSNLPPGTVTVRVHRDGYTPWEKNLLIEPTLVTSVRDIWLFPSEPLIDSLLNNVALFAASFNNQYLAVVTSDRTFHLLDEEGKDLLPVQPIPRLPSRLLWSPDSSRVLLQMGNNWYMVSIASQQPLRLLRSLSGALDVAWDPRIPGRLLITTPRRELRAYNVINETTATIARSISSFDTSSRNVYVAYNNGTIEMRSLQGELVKTLPPLSKKSITLLSVSPTGRIAAATSDGVWWLDESDTWQRLASSAKTLKWSLDSQLLLIQSSPNELSVLNAESDPISALPPGRLQLVTRLSRPISFPQWFAGSRHVIYQVDDQLIITEVDSRDRAISTTVDSTNTGNANPAVGRDGEKVFYIKQTKDGPTLVVASLLAEE